jgi:hypothetical protein
LPLIVKDRQIFLQKVINEVPHDTVKMGEVEFCAQFLAMMLLVRIRMESRVNFVDWRRFVLTLPEDWASLDIMQENIELVGLVGKPLSLRNMFEHFFLPIFLATCIGSADGASVVNMGGGLESGGDTMLWACMLMSWLRTK